MRKMTFAIVAALSFVATAASAQPPAGGPPMHRHGAVMPHAQAGHDHAQAGHEMGPMHAAGPLAKLNLTETQKEQIHKLMLAQGEKREAFARMPDLQRQLHAAIFRNQPTEEIARQINELQAQMLTARIAHMREVAQILTDEQREQMATLQPMEGMGRGGKK